MLSCASDFPKWALTHSGLFAFSSSSFYPFSASCSHCFSFYLPKFQSLEHLPIGGEFILSGGGLKSHSSPSSPLLCGLAFHLLKTYYVLSTELHAWSEPNQYLLQELDMLLVPWLKYLSARDTFLFSTHSSLNTWFCSPLSQIFSHIYLMSEKCCLCT